MSSLLKEAIVDAKALKEAALKNAEASVIDKYSEEVRKTLNTMLEQEEAPAAAAAPDMGADMGDPSLADADLMGGAAEALPVDGQEEAPETDIVPDVPLSALDGIGDSPDDEGEPVEFNVDLQALQEAVKELQSEVGADEEIQINEEDIAALLAEDEEELEEAETVDASEAQADADETEASAKQDDESDEGGLDEEVGADALVDAIMEKLTVDMGADLAGWAGRSSEDTVYQMEKEMAHRRSTEVEEEMKTLKKAQEELVFENNQLKDRLSQYEGAVGQLKENLQDVNLSNARLLYTNRVLRNTSLNERQKEKIVEAISNAGSVSEARTIYDTLESTVQSTPKRGPQSLGEAISRRSSVIRATRKESTPSDPISDRMKKLAGIK
jgi:hypothetical protein